ncbi:MAG TPA: ATP-binding cassette domain-containing protein [Stellaceae bacterium]|jgi:sodium transport system ATP-binding protein|nr:ATP-binding cassette domain-containing protein [Stellaceae bacterium]
MIEVRGLAKSFGALQVVENVSFVARDGEITGLIGPNGAGKTTMFRLISTVMRPDRGSMLVDGIDAVKNPLPARRRLGVLPDVRGLYTRLTAREHLRYFGELHGIPRRELAARIDELIRTLRMEDFIDRRTKGFSRGQQMKVALGRALIHRPHNIMLDEPTNGLDVATSRSVRDLLRQFRDEGRCVLLTSHIMQEVAALADRIVVLADGGIVLDGTPAELRRATGLHELEEIFMAAISGPPPDLVGQTALAVGQ